ncbi:hydrolase [Enterococcus faecium]|nr:hydrolase [Enterococcus faecium]MBO1092515.1 hydrolase [Enterococcus lactis]EGP5130414.1 hydrolase [Enterococcus faecium]EGP5187891.1 hydrolase [Enterococcus faecium]EGP5190947.1 hydrolase [Enterococcus faecium]
MASYRSRLNLSVTTSPLNGVQKLTFTVISSTKRKTGSTIFVWLFFLLDAGQLFHNFFFV